MKSEKTLYQWDVNQYLIELQPTAEFIDYPMGNEVIRLETDGTRCRIPDEVLQTYGGKTCYERYPDGTYRAYSFMVLYAPKPPDYIYTPEERTTFEALTARVDAAIEEIKRRADSGEFTPVKGVDYFTDAEKNEMMENVSSGAVGEFRKVVDTTTTEYNDNHNLKLAKYNANASEKLTTYDTNAEQHTTDYNRNAEQKLEAYNQNHTEKVEEYNQNAAALQTEVDRLRGECDQLAAENRKQENKISALIKLNKGQTYDILPEEGESASRTAPSGAKYVSVDKVGGKSIVWNQLCNPDEFDPMGCTPTESGGIVTISDCVEVNRYKAGFVAVTKGHKYYQTVKIKSDGENPVGFQNYLFLDVVTKTTSAEFIRLSEVAEAKESGNAMIQLWSVNATNYQIVKNSFMLFDLTLLFGADNEPTAEQFEAMFPADSYQYNPGEIISSRTATITAGAETIETGFPELRSTLAVHDYIDMDAGFIRRNVGVVDLGTLDWQYERNYKFMFSNVPGKKKGSSNCLCPRYNLSAKDIWTQGGDGIYGGNDSNNTFYIKDTNFTEPLAFKEAIKGVALIFELEIPTTEQVAIPEALQEWLPVEAGGTVTFQNADESKQLPVPNAVRWVRKLNEVK